MRTTPDAVWWRLPGPDGFLDQVVRCLRNGVTAVVEVPRQGIPDVKDEIRRRAEDEGRWNLQELSEESVLSGPDRSVVQYLRRRFVPSWPAGEVADGHRVLGADTLQRMLAVAEIQDPGSACLWNGFLAEYGSYGRDLDSSTRPVFALIVRRPVELDRIPSVPLVDRLVWQGRISRLDMQYLASHMISRNGQSPLLQLVQISVVAELSGFDPVLAFVLSSLTLDQLLQPRETLLDFGRRGSFEDVQATWSDGGADHVDGRDLVHSAILAMRGDHDELNRRIWRGQVAAVFPHLETCRLSLVELGRRYLPRMPLETHSGVVERADELEIGPLCHFLRQNQRAHYLLPRARLLLEVRNHLAHRTPVAAPLLRRMGALV